MEWGGGWLRPHCHKVVWQHERQMRAWEDHTDVLSSERKIGMSDTSKILSTLGTLYVSHLSDLGM